MMYSSGKSSGDSQSSSRYSFYVVLHDKDVIAEGNDSMSTIDKSKLIIGQHVYIEPDNGAGAVKEGLWLPSYYLVQEDGAAYVWARNGSEKLEKRTVALGDYDADNDAYEIKEGLSADDYLAMPDASLKNGLPTTTEMTDEMFTGDMTNIGGMSAEPLPEEEAAANAGAEVS